MLKARLLIFAGDVSFVSAPKHHDPPLPARLLQRTTEGNTATLGSLKDVEGL